MINLSSRDGMDVKIIITFQTIQKMRSDRGIEDSWFGTPSESLMRESIEAGEAIPLTQEPADCSAL